MPTYCTPKLEFSTDPLSVSNASATWKDVTRYCLDASWGNGSQNETDAPEAGQATFVLKNSERRFEPEYAAGAYYPNIVPGRRFRLSITADGASSAEGIWYATDWQVEYPAGTTYSTVTVTCTDGFWRLSLNRLGPLPGNAEDYASVLQADNPIGLFPLDENGPGAMGAIVGNEGNYKAGFVEHVKPSPVTGFYGYAASFLPGTQFGRSKLDDVDVFKDAGQFSVEISCNISSASNSQLAVGPFITGVSAGQFTLRNGDAELRSGGSSFSTTPTSFVAGSHHHCATWDGSTLVYYRDGTVIGSISAPGNLTAADANEYLYVGTGGHGTSMGTTRICSYAAFYDYALTPTQVSAHANAAINLGYSVQTSGTRIAALATDPLWSTAGITAGTINVQPRFQAGQLALEEITTTLAVEKPGALFYFDESGNPDYQALMDPMSPAATFGDIPSEIQYDQITLTYNDELFSTSTVSAEGLMGATAQNTQSISDYGTRAHDETSLIITSNSDAALLAQSYVDRFGTPKYRVAQISLNASQQNTRTQILAREIGDTIRVRRRGEGGTAVDFITRIIAKEKHIGPDNHLTATWTLARGFNATTVNWHLNVTGYDELGQTTVLA